MTSDWPVVTPVYGTALVEHLAAKRAEEGERPKAAGTPFRASDAARCARYLSLEAAGIKKTVPVDDSGLAVMHMGTLRHEAFEPALLAKYPDAQFEVEGTAGLDPDHPLVSFHADFYLPSANTLGEEKNVGAYAFDKATGIDRRRAERKNPEGPKIGAKVQGALCAYGLGAETLVVINFSNEAVSVRTAEKLGLSETDRWMAEWHYPRSVWEPWALDELARLDAIAADLRDGNLAERIAVADDGSLMEVDPEARKPWWGCDYCAHRPTCEALGPGEVPVPVQLSVAS